MSSSSREHNHGPQTREYTSAQAAAVNRVKKCKVTDYYAVLDIESSATETEIRKAYRKLALIMHPDKNGAPGADEAFKMVSKAFQVLSDPQKKRIFDQTGMDPESRGVPSGGGGGGPSMFTRAPGGGAAGMHEMPFGPDTTPMIFSTCFSAGAGGPQHGTFQTQFGPGIRVHFNGPGNPFHRRAAKPRPRKKKTYFQFYDCCRFCCCSLRRCSRRFSVDPAATTCRRMRTLNSRPRPRTHRSITRPITTCRTT